MYGRNTSEGRRNSFFSLRGIVKMRRGEKKSELVSYQTLEKKKLTG